MHCWVRPKHVVAARPRVWNMSVIVKPALVERSVATKRPESTGLSHPLGATVLPVGVNFSVFSRNASRVELLLFDREDDSRAAHVFPIEASTNRAYHYWHVLCPA